MRRPLASAGDGPVGRGRLPGPGGPAVASVGDVFVAAADAADVTVVGKVKFVDVNEIA